MNAQRRMLVKNISSEIYQLKREIEALIEDEKEVFNEATEPLRDIDRFHKDLFAMNCAIESLSESMDALKFIFKKDDEAKNNPEG